MSWRLASAVILSLVLCGLAAAIPAAAWTLVLADSATVAPQPVRISDVARGELPTGVGDLFIAGAAGPGESFTVSRNLILRRLRTAGMAAGLRLEGATVCSVSVAGRNVDHGVLEEQIRQALQSLLPAPLEGAPLPWIEVDPGGRSIPDMAAAAEWELRLSRREVLAPGRNLVQIEVCDGDRRIRFSSVVVCHAYGETARVASFLRSGDEVSAGNFIWEWTDLASLTGGIVVGRDALNQKCARRNLDVGIRLRGSDLGDIPLVLAGETVRLLIRRGAIQLTARATARQDGARGQVVTVRNGLNGRLVTARVTGRGVVEWMR